MIDSQTASPTWLWLLALSGAIACSGGEPGPADSTDDGGIDDVTSGGTTAAGVGGTDPLSAGGTTASGGNLAAVGGSPDGSGGDSISAGGGSMDSGGGPPATGGSSDGSGGAVSGSGGQEDLGDPAAPEGVIPNEAYPEDKVNVPKDNWQSGLVSDTLETGHHNQPSIINGYLQITGNSLFAMYDISDPSSPQKLSAVRSPNGGCDSCGEAEGHQIGFAKYGNKFYTATIQGHGIDLWDITDVRNPVWVSEVVVNGINYGDFTEAVWGVAWQGSVIFIGGTNTGVHVVDASDPENPELIGKITNLGGVSAGPVFPVGNTLVVTTPKSNAGVATVDVSDPSKPVLLSSVTPPEESYIGWFYGHHAYLLNPIRVYDVLTNPTSIQLVSGNRPGGYFEYMSFQDGYMFAGRIRPEPGATKIDVSDLSNFKFESDIYGRRNLQENDDQFTVAVGNLLIMSDDQLSPGTGLYAGTVIAVHDNEPDTTPPRVDSVGPKDGATGQAVTSRVGISFTDNVELATVDSRSFIVRPVGGTAMAGTYGVSMSVLHFDPEGDFDPATTYEVVLPAGGVKDYVGNGIAEEFVSTFTTK